MKTSLCRDRNEIAPPESDAERKQFIEALVQAAEVEHRGSRDNKPPLGIEKVLTQRPTDRPLNPSFRPRTKVYCLDDERSDPCGWGDVLSEGRKLALLKRNPHVGFCVFIEGDVITGDKACDFGQRYESVVGEGVMEVLRDREAKKRGLDVLMRRFGGPAVYYDKMVDRTNVMALRITALSGKRNGLSRTFDR